MPNRQQNVTFRALVGFAVGVIGLAVVAIGLTLWSLRIDSADDAARDIENIATVLGEQTARSIQSMDLVLSEVQDKLAELGAATPESFRQIARSFDVHRLLTERLERLPQASVMALIDDTGRYANTTRRWPPPDTSLADEDSFRHALGGRDRDLFISEPVTSRASGHRTVYFSRRVESPTGGFLGVIVVGAEVAYFQHVYDAIQSPRDQSFMLARDDGTVLVFHPADKDRAGLKMPEGSPWYRMVARGGGYYSAPGLFDDEPRLIAVQPLRDYPLVVSVAVSKATAFATWQRRAILIGCGTLLAVIVCIFLLRTLLNQINRLAQSQASLAEREARLAEKTRELERVNVQTEAALNNITQGLCMFDEHARIVVFNQRYIDMYGLSRAIVRPGCTLHSLICHRRDVGLFKGDPDQYCEDIIGAIRTGKTSAQLIETTDGRTIYAVQQPMGDGGWVVTHDDITERRRAEEQMAFMARHDALTGLANRVLLLERMEEALARLRRHGGAFTVFVFDLDLFKGVNDSLGHPVGDALLKAVAQRLKACTRETDTVARLGGDEFALLQTVESDQRDGAIILANRLLAAISAPYEIDGHQIVIGTSIGIVLAPSDASDADHLLKNADLALYRAKSEGRNGYRLFEVEMGAEARSRHALQTDLRNAILRDEFELHFQTIHDVATRAPCGAEALVRWRHPSHGLVQPTQFIQLAEEIGMIIPLGEWILRKACAEAASWPSHIKLAVNLSPAQFRNCNLVDIVTDALAESGLSPEQLELEVTESVLLQKNAGNLTTLHQLKSLGISIVLDDFGTGYSSLSYLRMFPFDKIKIDKSFVGELSNRADCAAIVCAVAGLGRGLKVLTTAEGVETEEQFGLLRAAGVDQVQGFLLSRPCLGSELRFLFQHTPASGRAA